MFSRYLENVPARRFGTTEEVRVQRLQRLQKLTDAVDSSWWTWVTLVDTNTCHFVSMLFIICKNIGWHKHMNHFVSMLFIMWEHRLTPAHRSFCEHVIYNVRTSVDTIAISHSMSMLFIMWAQCDPAVEYCGCRNYEPPQDYERIHLFKPGVGILPIYLPTHPPTYLPTHLPTHQLTYPPTYTYLSTHPPTYPPTCLPYWNARPNCQSVS